jgi:hypothetical protein
MSHPDDPKLHAKREYAQLLRLHEQLLVRLQRVLEDLTSANTQSLLKEIRTQTGSAPELTDVTTSVEESIRALKLSESRVRAAVLDSREALEIEGVPNLPTHLERFLAEKAALPGFSYEVIQDDVRGWVICWKEHTADGQVRAYGQINERPYAWIED